VNWFMIIGGILICVALFIILFSGPVEPPDDPFA